MAVSSLFDLSNKVAVITGSSRGIGRAIAERMAEYGAKVVVSSRKLDACDEVVAAITAKGGTAFAHPCRNIAGSFRLGSIERVSVKRYPAWSRVTPRCCGRVYCRKKTML